MYARVWCPDCWIEQPDDDELNQLHQSDCPHVGVVLWTKPLTWFGSHCREVIMPT